MSTTAATRLSDDDQEKIAEAVATMLSLQLAAAGREVLPQQVRARALGYIYGFIDAALRTIGQDMADVTLGVPVTFHVLRRLFPGREREYLDRLNAGIRTDRVMVEEMMYGGQQYLDFNNGKLAAPMGLACIVLAADDPPASRPAT